MPRKRCDVLLYEKGQYSTCLSPRHYRPRGVYYGEEWEHGYFVENQGKRIGLSEEVENLNITIKERGELDIGVEQIHSDLFKILTPHFYRVIAKAINNPGVFVGEHKKRAIKERNTDIMIIGCGASSIGLISKLIGKREVIAICNEIGGRLGRRMRQIHGIDIRKFEEVMIRGKYLGLFEEGYLIETSDEFQVIRPKITVFANGGKYLPPLIRNNDLPGFLSGDYFERLLDTGFKVKNVAFIDESGVSKDIKFLYDKSTAQGIEVTVFSREKIKGLNCVRIKDTYSLVGRWRVEGVQANGEYYKADIAVFLGKRYPSIEVPVNAGLEFDFVSDFVIPKHSITGKIGNNYVIGNVRGIEEINTSFMSGVIAGMEIMGEKVEESKEFEVFINSLKSEESDLYNYYEGKKGEIKKSFIIDDNSYICPCEDIKLKDLKGDYTSTEEVKRITGLGSGICQGKICIISLSRILRNKGIKNPGLMTFRSPIYPTSFMVD